MCLREFARFYKTTTLNLRLHDKNVACGAPGRNCNARQIVASPQPYSCNRRCRTHRRMRPETAAQCRPEVGHEPQAIGRLPGLQRQTETRWKSPGTAAPFPRRRLTLLAPGLISSNPFVEINPDGCQRSPPHEANESRQC
jgi:hypothetical protein